MVKVNLEIARLLLTVATNSTNNSSNTTSLQCQFFDATGYVTQAMLAFFSFSVLLCKIIKLNNEINYIINSKKIPRRSTPSLEDLDIRCFQTNLLRWCNPLN